MLMPILAARKSRELLVDKVRGISFWIKSRKSVFEAVRGVFRAVGYHIARVLYDDRAYPTETVRPLL